MLKQRLPKGRRVKIESNIMAREAAEELWPGLVARAETLLNDERFYEELIHLAYDKLRQVRSPDASAQQEAGSVDPSRGSSGPHLAIFQAG